MSSLNRIRQRIHRIILNIVRNNRYWSKFKAKRLQANRSQVSRSYSDTGIRSKLGCTSAKPFGVNLAGFLNSEKGLGTAVRADALALESAGIPYVLNAARDRGSKSVETIKGIVREDNPYSINILHMNADQTDYFAGTVGSSYFYDHYNIGYWAWELSTFPDTWQGVTDYYDEIWCPSTFIRDAVSQRVDMPVHSIPTAVPAANLSDGTFDRAYFGIPDRRFMFLFIFDFSSYMVRKNPTGLIEAFKRAHFSEDEAVLVIKCTHGEDYLDDYEILKKAVVPGVQVINQLMEREEIHALMSLCDCYVSLHRAEGFGLTIMEAMAAGKPVITTAYSGNMDFTTPENSFLADYDLVEIEQDHNVYKKGYVWAEPSVEHAAVLMRSVYQNQDAAKKVGDRARADIKTGFSIEAVGRIMRNRLLNIAETEAMHGQPSDENQGAER